MSTEPGLAEKSLRDAVLCTPFPRDSRSSGEAETLAAEVQWVTQAAAEAGFSLRPVKDLYDNNEQIIEKICDAIRGAALVIVIVAENNPNVFFEAGFALGLSKPILYVARDDTPIPFDVTGVEHFTARELDEGTRARAAAAMQVCAAAAADRLASSSSFARLQKKLTDLGPAPSLLGACQRHAFDDLADWVGGWSDTSLEITGAVAVLDMGCHIMSKVGTSGFATSYYSGHSSWRHTDSYGLAPDYFRATREAVEQGAEVTRVYVVDHPDQVDEQAFRERAWADSSAGIRIRYILSSELPDTRARDFGLWDEALICEVEYATLGCDSPPILQRCRYWSDEGRLKWGREWRSRIEERSSPCPDLPSEHQLLVESAPASLAIGGCEANRGGEDEEDCSAYHAAWQPLRLANLVSTPRWHADFYAGAFHSWSERAAQETEGPVKVLITGLADYGMLYWAVQSIIPTVRKRCQFHVLDICNTPLDSARWLRERLHACNPPLDLNLTCLHEDVFRNSCEPASMDLIATDAFLTRFESDQKSDLLDEWLRLRAPSGWIVTTARIRQGVHDIRTAERQAFDSRATAASTELGPEMQMFVREAAQGYSRYITSHPFQSESAVGQFLAKQLGDLEHRYEFRAIDDWEMVKANYACIKVGPGVSRLGRSVANSALSSPPPRGGGSNESRSTSGHSSG